MPDPYPRTQLCLMLEQYGRDILSEPKRCKGLLYDLAPQNRLEINLLIVALEQKITDELLKPSTLTPIEIQLDRLAQSLHDATGIEEELAYWAVESWALALSVIAQPIEKPIVQPNPSPFLPAATSSSKTTRKKTLITFFISWLVAGILLAGVITFSSKTQHKNSITKPPAIKKNVPEVNKVENASALEPLDAWTANNLGDTYYYIQDYSAAVAWYRKAAEQGYAVGQCNLGFMYTNGYGVPKDYKEAVVWYRKAAEQDNADGQNNLGIMYENGYGVVQDTQQAIEWYRKAVEHGHYGAQQTLRNLLEKS